MSEGNLPVVAFPEGVDPNAPYVSFVKFECRTCSDQSDWMSGDSRDVEEHAWDGEHEAITGHAKFYVWTISRNTAQVWRLKD